MIISCLGNQMFQHAFGRALALSKSVELRLDLSAFTGHTPHNGFELERVFNISTQAASGADFRRALGWRAAPTILRALRRNARPWRRR